MSTNYGSLYKLYTNGMYEAKRQAKINNLPMANSYVYSRDDFKYLFDATKRMVIAKGNTDPTNREVINALIAKQQYASSEAEGKNIARAMQMRGLEIDNKTARALYRYVSEDELAQLPASQQAKARQIQQFFNEIKEYRQELKNKGLDNAAIQTLISQVFFGSE